MIRHLILLLGAAMVAYGTYQTARATQLANAYQAQNVELQACGARLQNIIEDIASDEAAADLVDDLSAIPPHWLRGAGN
jgi:peroxiredoxin family protein